MTEEMQIIAVCEEMGWDYYQYLNQPEWFLELLKSKMEIDSDNIRKQMKKSKRG